MRPEDVLAKQIHTFGFWNRYRNIVSRLRYNEASPLRLLIHEFRKEQLNRSGEVVLDFGFGNGNAIFWFAPPSEIFGVEVSREAIQSAEKRAAKRRFSVYNFGLPSGEDSTGIPFPENFFSVIIASHTLEHVYSDETLLHELYRVCRPGGKIFLAIPLDIHDEEWIFTQADRLNPDFPLKSFHVFRYNLKTITYLVTMSGFRVLRSYPADAIMDFRGKNMWGRLATRILFSFIPLPVWFLLDRYLREKGFRFRQGILVAEK